LNISKSNDKKQFQKLLKPHLFKPLETQQCKKGGFIKKAKGSGH